MYIAVDIGATNIRVAEFDGMDHPQLLDFKSEKTSPDYQASLKKIKVMVGDRKPERVGVGAPGSANLPKWRDQDLQKDLENLLGCPVILQNDVAAAASGEAHYGSPENSDFLFVSWGTGIGGAFVHNLQVTPTQIGHQIIVKNGKECGCSQHGCLEAYCGGKYIKSDDLLPGIVPHFAQGLVNCVAIRPVPLIVFAGGLAVHQPKILASIETEVKNIIKIVVAPKFRMATFGDQAGIYGALSLLKSTL